MTKQIEDGGPAHPHPVRNEQCEWDVATGMTLRDYFAGQALMGLLASPGEPPATDWPSKRIAEMAYFQADAMIEARKGDAS